MSFFVLLPKKHLNGLQNKYRGSENRFKVLSKYNWNFIEPDKCNFLIVDNQDSVKVEIKIISIQDGSHYSLYGTYFKNSGGLYGGTD